MSDIRKSVGRSTAPGGRLAPLQKLAQIVVAVLQTLMPLTASVLNKGEARYWERLPFRRMTGVLLALFFTFSGIGFFLDLINWQSLPLWALLTSAVLIGASGVTFFAVLRRRRLRLVPLLVGLAAAVTYVMGWLPHGSPIPVTAAAHNRMVLDGIGILAAGLLGYRFFLRFISVAGIEQIRTRTELELAHGIQRTLVPIREQL